jgi:hypothetical protein
MWATVTSRACTIGTVAAEIETAHSPDLPDNFMLAIENVLFVEHAFVDLVQFLAVITLARLEVLDVDQHVIKQ